VLLVSGGTWELTSLLQQPQLTTDSYAHPTISALTDPIAGSSSWPLGGTGRMAAHRLVRGGAMSSRDLTIIGYVAVLAAGIALQEAAVAMPERRPSHGRVFTDVMRTRTGQVGVCVAWAWIGLHFFAR
jgi:Family of unknown function (DUF6186)